MSSASVRLRSAAVALGAFALVVGGVKVLHLAKLRGVTPAQAALEPAAANIAPRIELPKDEAPQAPSLAGLDLARITVSDTEATAPLPRDRVAHLTVDARLQRAALALIKQHRLPEATIVMMDPDTGAILAYASHGPTHRDLAVEATAPSASVFKLVTATALVEKEGIAPDTRACFPRSAGQRIIASDLVVDPLRDKWCESVATAMGKSENAVFARLAHEKLDKATLEDAARALGYGAPIAFDAPVQAGKLEVPDNVGDALGFARTAAGFWNTTLSPLQAAFISATVARDGEAVRPHIVARITDGPGKLEWQAPVAPETHRAISESAAQALTTMMEHTVSEGTSYRAFHDSHRTPFVPVQVAGKTGTLTGEGPRLYSWFTGFAPSHPRAGQKRVAVAVLVVNKPKWHVKANVVAREMLREFYRGEHVAVASR
ncbi:MAG TPA: penicillin-binding transpeptidase domain-containing protein [Polyangiaceae bacterium]|jgi:cell division protein FtsI/penicillin-binding protein 2